jgi:hypothetical protein
VKNEQALYESKKKGKSYMQQNKGRITELVTFLLETVFLKSIIAGYIEGKKV